MQGRRWQGPEGELSLSFLSIVLPCLCHIASVKKQEGSKILFQWQAKLACCSVMNDGRRQKIPRSETKEDYTKQPEFHLLDISICHLCLQCDGEQPGWILCSEWFYIPDQESQASNIQIFIMRYKQNHHPRVRYYLCYTQQ